MMRPTTPISDRTRITRSLSRSLSRSVVGATGVSSPDSAADMRLRRGESEGRSATAQQQPTAATTVRGLIRCLCDRFLLSPSDILVECTRCFNWCHLLCTGIDPKALPIAKKSFVCVFCKEDEEGRGEDGAPRRVGEKRRRSESLSNNTTTANNGSSSTTVSEERKKKSSVVVGAAPPPRQIPVRLTEVKDCPPPDVAALTAISDALRSLAISLGFELLEFGVSSASMTFSDELVEQCMDCCSSSIADATFSDSYPRYCMRELQQQHHSYLQATLVRCKATSTVVSLVFSNGMDPYGNLKSTITQLKRAMARASSLSSPPSSMAGGGGLDVGGGGGGVHCGEFSTQCMAISDFSDFVHVTLTATHAEYRNRGLAKISMLNELVRWLRRGRNRAFLNMALEKRIAPSSTTLTCAPPVASRNLYNLFGFQDVFPRVVKGTGEFRWTALEADMGRVMANLDVRSKTLEVARDVLERFKARKALDAHIDHAVDATAAPSLPASTSLRLRRLPVGT